SHLNSLGSFPVLFAVPGNHDLQRPNPKNPAARMLTMWEQATDIHDELWQESDSEYRKLIEQAFTNYQQWWQRTPLRQKQGIAPGLLPGDFSASWTKDGLNIGLVGLNTTFLQLGGGDYRKKLAWDSRQLHLVCSEDSAAWTKQHHACLLMTHQPPEWLNSDSRERVYGEINPAGRFAVHLFGHMHENAIRNSSAGGGETLRYWQGSSLFGLEHFGDEQALRSHGYAAGRIEVNKAGKGYLRHWPRKAVADKVNGWRFEPDRDSGVLNKDDGTKRDKIKLLQPWSQGHEGHEEQGAQPAKVDFAIGQSEARYKQTFLHQYQAAMLRESDIIRLSGLPEGDKNLVMQKILLRQLYVPLRMSIEINRDENIDNLAQLEQNREFKRLSDAGRNVTSSLKQTLQPVATRLAQARRLVILGDPGAGKTTLLRWLATANLLRLTNDPDLAQLPDIDSLPAETWLPLVVRCRELAVENCTFDEILQQTLRKAELAAGELEMGLLKQELTAGRLLLLIDGLDEITDPTQRARFCAQLERIASAYPKAPMIVTSRIVGYREMHYRIGEGFEHGVLAELSKDDKDDFIRRWCIVTENKERQASAQAELIAAVHVSDRIERLTGNPMLLTTLALVKRKVGKLPTRRSELYREAVAVLLNWRSELDTPLDSREAHPQLEYIAYEMCKRGVQQLRGDELIDLLDRVRRDYPNIRPIHQRTPEQFLALLEARTGLIVEVGETKHNGQMLPVYEFRHLTFQEYLAGLALVEGHFPNYDRSCTLGQRIAPLAGQVVWSEGEDEGLEVTENWREALRLCIACCNDELVDEAMLAILHPLAGEDEDRIQKPRAILALLCLADEPNVTQVVGMEVIEKFVGVLDEFDSDFGGTNALKAARELVVSDWKHPLVEYIAEEFIRLDSDESRGDVGSFLSKIITVDIVNDKVTPKNWIEQQVINLQGNEVTAINAALAIMQVAFNQKAQMTDGLVEGLLALINKTAASAHSGSWALFMLSGGFLNKGVWQPKIRELEQLVAYLSRPAADAEALTYIAWIIKNHPTKKALEPCLVLLKHCHTRTRQAAVDALGAIKDPRAVEPLIELLTDRETSVRRSCLGVLANINEDQTDVKLLSQYINGMLPWLDPQQPIGQAHINKAAKVLKIPKAEVIKRLTRLAKKYNLTLAL
ncbi:MAG: energy-coupling factor transporter ATP-binding protein EcfA2, partial [Phenylobacterium sp.]